MQCVDKAEIPAVAAYERDSFEDEMRFVEAGNESQFLVCGYHPNAQSPVHLGIQERNWQRCKRIYDILLMTGILIVILIHLLFLVDILRETIRRAYRKQTHLHVEEAEESDSLRGNSSMVAITTPSPVERTSTTTTSTVADRQFPKGMTQEDYIDFERYEHFIYAHARDL